MDIKYPIENKHMKCVLQINGFSGLRPRVRSNRRVGSVRGCDSSFISLCNYESMIEMGPSMSENQVNESQSCVAPPLFAQARVGA